MIIDNSLPYYNILMRCEAYAPASICLPEGYRFRGYRDGDAAEWARMEHRIGDFKTFEEAYRYFLTTYLGDIEALKRRLICAVNEEDEAAGYVIAWREPSGDGVIAAVHWLVVSPHEQEQGIGRALMLALLERYHTLGEFPVYLHSQPCSYVAVGLYSSLGFKVLRHQSVMGYENQFGESMAVLQTLMAPAKFEKLLLEAIG